MKEKSLVLPLYAQCQDDAIVTLQGLLAFVGSAGVPHLRENREGYNRERRLCLLSRKNTQVNK